MKYKIEEEFTTPDGVVVPKGAVIEVVEDTTPVTEVPETPEVKTEEISDGKTRIMEKRRAKFTEMSRNDVAFTVVYVNAMESVMVELTPRNYDNVKDLAKEALQKLQAVDPDASDDFWIDDVFPDSRELSNLDVEWKDLLAPNLHLDQSMVDLVFDEPLEFSVKAQTLNDYGYDVDEDSLDLVTVYDASGEDTIKGFWDSKFPEEWLYDEAEMMGADSMILDNWSLFNQAFASFVSQDAPNGKRTFNWVGDYFTVM